MVINGFGGVATAVVMVVFAVTKFRDGAWIFLFLIPALVRVFSWIHHHYRTLARSGLSLDDYRRTGPPVARHRVILPMSGVHRGTLAALRYASARYRSDITAVHVSIDSRGRPSAAQVGDWGDGVRLVILESPYRLVGAAAGVH